MAYVTRETVEKTNQETNETINVDRETHYNDDGGVNYIIDRNDPNTQQTDADGTRYGVFDEKMTQIGWQVVSDREDGGQTFTTYLYNEYNDIVANYDAEGNFEDSYTSYMETGIWDDANELYYDRESGDILDEDGNVIGQRDRDYYETGDIYTYKIYNEDDEYRIIDTHEDSDGLVKEEIKVDGETVSVTERTENEEHYTKYETRDGDGNVTQTEEYYDNALIVTDYERASDGSLMQSVTTEYSSDNADGNYRDTPDTQTVISYDENGNERVVTENSFDEEENITHAETEVYDSDGELTKEIIVDYDSEGNMTHEVVKDGDGNVISDRYPDSERMEAIKEKCLEASSGIGDKIKDYISETKQEPQDVSKDDDKDFKKDVEKDTNKNDVDGGSGIDGGIE